MAVDPQNHSQEDAFALPPQEQSRYFFDAFVGEEAIIDGEGLELENSEAARAEAIKRLRDIARGKLPDGDLATAVVRVRDDTGETILMASLTLTVQRMR